MHPDHIHLLVLQGPLTLVPLPPSKKWEIEIEGEGENMYELQLMLFMYL